MPGTRQPLSLTRPPLLYVVAQVRISPVESIRKSVPDIQDSFRRRGFPRFVEGEIQNVRIRPNSPPEITPTPVFEFQDKSRRLGIVLAKDFVSFHASRYPGFEQLQSMLKMVLGTIGEIVGPELVERVGLRYVNLIRTAPEEPFSEYVSSGLLGLDAGRFEATSPKVSLQQISKTAHGTLAVRLFQRDDGELFPPDTRPSLAFADPDPELRRNELVSLLDLDHFREYDDALADFSVEKVVELFGSLHNNIDLAFRTAVTPRAMKMWGQDEYAQVR